jgi:Holliday junction resolvasome RuvABC ATP-dependent DNA helicase subunit
MSSLLEKYKPKKLKEWIGNDLIIKNLKDFIKNYNSSKKCYLTIEGPHNSGKSELTKLFFESLGYRIHQFSYENFKEKTKLLENIKQVYEYRNILNMFEQNNTRNVLIFDELEALASSTEKSILNDVISIFEKYRTKGINKCNHPIVFIINENTFSKLKTISKYGSKIKFKFNSHIKFEKILNSILKKENINLSNEKKKELLISSKGNFVNLIKNIEFKYQYQFNDIRLEEANVSKNNNQIIIELINNVNKFDYYDIYTDYINSNIISNFNQNKFLILNKNLISNKYNATKFKKFMKNNECLQIYNDFLNCNLIHFYMNRDKLFILQKLLIYYLYPTFNNKFESILGAKIYISDLDIINIYNRFSIKCMSDKNKKEKILNFYGNKKEIEFNEILCKNDI